MCSLSRFVDAHGLFGHPVTGIHGGRKNLGVGLVVWHACGMGVCGWGWGHLRGPGCETLRVACGADECLLGISRGPWVWPSARKPAAAERRGEYALELTLRY